MKALGFALLAMIFGGIFWATAQADGWRTAAIVWGGSILITAAIVFGVLLATGTVS